MNSIERVHQLVRFSTTPPEPVIALLAKTVIGTKGMQYRLVNAPEKVFDLHQPHFIYLQRGNKAIGSITLCQREVMLNKAPANAYYIRYFAFDAIFRSGGKKSNHSTGFQTYFNALFSSSNLNPIEPKQDKAVYWAYIDPDNLRSFNMNERFGFQTIGQFRTRVFSRFRPRLKKGVERLQRNDLNEVKQHVNAFYANARFYADTHLFEKNNYFVLREKGKIVAGIQIHQGNWEIADLPGLSGKFLMKTGAYLPGFKKLINPKDYRFLASEGLFWLPGHAHRIADLLEGVLAITGYHSLLVYGDEHDDNFNQLSAVKWGLLQKIRQDNPILIVAKFIGHSPEEIETIIQSRKYLSGYDVC